MWKAVYDSVGGTSHDKLGSPCQDSCRVKELERDGRSYLLVVCADGAGSASHAEHGAQLVCDRFIEISSDAIIAKELESITREDAISWCQDLRSSLSKKANEFHVSLRELACTFMAAVLGNTHAIFFHIGDGAMAIRCGSELKHVFWPQSGDYVNTTHFLTDQEFDQWLQFESTSQIVSEFAAFTDGLERLCLSFASQTVHAPFFEPMFRVLRQANDTEEYFEHLRSFLGSPAINDRTDDDKTLVLATRLRDFFDGQEHPRQ